MSLVIIIVIIIRHGKESPRRVGESRVERAACLALSMASSNAVLPAPTSSLDRLPACVYTR